MDVNRLSIGEKIVGVSAIVLLLDMFIFKWFGLSGGGSGISKNAWGSFDFIDIVLLLAVLAGLALVYLRASETRLELPIAVSVVVTALAALGTLLVIYRLIDPPDLGFGSILDVAGDSVDHERKIGAFIGFLSVAALAYGGYRSMQEEGSTFQDTADRFSDRGRGTGTGAGTGTGSGTGSGTGGTTPPPPPPPSGGTSGTGGVPPA